MSYDGEVIDAEVTDVRDDVKAPEENKDDKKKESFGDKHPKAIRRAKKAFVWLLKVLGIILGGLLAGKIALKTVGKPKSYATMPILPSSDDPGDDAFSINFTEEMPAAVDTDLPFDIEETVTAQSITE